MLYENAKSEILNVVQEKQGCKLTELIPLLSKEVICSKLSIVDVVNELIKENKLISIEYVISKMPYRCKTFLLPHCDYLLINDYAHYNSTMTKNNIRIFPNKKMEKNQ